MSHILLPTTEEAIVSAARVVVGDGLRSVVLFTPDDFEILYLRQDLYPDEEHAREAKALLVEAERRGFAEQASYEAGRPTEFGPEIGDYLLTTRLFSEGEITRVLVDDRGVLLTMDDPHGESFEDLAVTLQKLLADEDSA